MINAAHELQDLASSPGNRLEALRGDLKGYIDWLNAGRHEEVLFQRDAVKYLSAVVMLELYAGAFSPRDRRVVRNVVAAFARGSGRKPST